MFKFFTKLSRALDIYLQNEQDINDEIESTEDGPVCPHFKTPCVGSDCLAFKTFPHEWDETEMILIEETGRMEDTETGRRLSGNVANCKLGIFTHLVIDQQEIESVEKKSKLVQIS